ncbi:MAG: class I SAM-dependent methyltransferase [Steroidobacteraceae bacterium]
MSSPKVPSHLARCFTELSAAQVDALVASLQGNYFPRRIWGDVALSSEQWLATPEGQRDLDEHTRRRLHAFRTQIVPWLDSARALSGARILEIGCGTGASTVALAEQGANVTAIDIDEESLVVARDRCRLHRVDAEFVRINGAATEQLPALGQFDFVIFFACLEHMTYAERLAAMRATWGGLKPGALWCSIETPNRLWWFDEHTSFLPFYNWLPDELAFDYSRYSSRDPFRRSYRERTDEAFTSFLRHGRGVSYHEFELTMKDAAQLDVVSSLPLWLRRDGLFGWRALKRLRKRKHRYERLIASLRPDLHRGFFQPYLDLIVRKD